jgi:hypothetical protein
MNDFRGLLSEDSCGRINVTVLVADEERDGMMVGKVDLLGAME